jgi:transaldolase
VKLFVDSADATEIGACVAAAGTTGVITSGARLQQAAQAADRPPQELLRDICGVANGPVGVELAAGPSDREAMLREARLWAGVAANVVVLAPAADAGLEIVRACAAERIRSGIGVGRSPEQALAAARAGANYLSAPVGRAGGFDADDQIRKLAALLRTFEMTTEIVAIPIRSPSDVIDAAVAGAHAAAVPAAVLRELPAETMRRAGDR